MVCVCVCISTHFQSQNELFLWRNGKDIFLSNIKPEHHFVLCRWYRCVLVASEKRKAAHCGFPQFSKFLHIFLSEWIIEILVGMLIDGQSNEWIELLNDLWWWKLKKRDYVDRVIYQCDASIKANNEFNNKYLPFMGFCDQQIVNNASTHFNGKLYNLSQFKVTHHRHSSCAFQSLVDKHKVQPQKRGILAHK